MGGVVVDAAFKLLGAIVAATTSVNDSNNGSSDSRPGGGTLRIAGAKGALAWLGRLWLEQVPTPSACHKMSEDGPLRYRNDHNHLECLRARGRLLLLDMVL